MSRYGSDMLKAFGRWTGCSSELIGRVLVTVAAVAGVIGLSNLPVPGLILHDGALLGLSQHPVHLGGLGLVPFAVGIVAVELLDRLRPGGGDRRYGVDRSGAVGRIGVIVGLGIALVQAAAVAGYWLWLLPAEVELFAAISWELGWKSGIVVTGSLLAGACLHALAAHIIREFGIGEGFSVVFGVGFATQFVPASRKFADWLQTMSLQRLDVFGVLGNSLAVAVAILGTIWLLVRGEKWITVGERERAHQGPEIETATVFSIPGAGFVPFLIGSGLTWAFGMYRAVWAHPISTWGRKGLEGAAFGGTFMQFVQQFAIVVGVAALLGWWTVHSDARRSDRREEPSKRARWRALCVSVAFVGGLTVLDVYGGTLLRSLGVVPVVLGTALVLDLRREWRFRRAFPESARVATVHRTEEVGPVLDDLAGEHVPAVARGWRFLGLLRWFGAFSAVEILVPASEAETATRILDERRREE